ncbi:MAG: arylsulfatase, partial [Mesorhizobium sp.]
REQGFLLRTDDISDETLATAIAHTHGMIQMIDDAVGRLIAALDGAGVLDDTYVLFTADHGELLGDHGLLRKGPPPYRQLLPLIEGRVYNVRDFLFAEYHPRRDASLYNQSVISKEWRFTRYPNQPAWGELFDLREDAWEHWNLFSEQAFSAQLRALNAVLDQRLPPQPLIINEVLGAY